MKITRIYPSTKELDGRDIYLHTKAKATSIKDVKDGLVIKPLEIVQYEDTNDKGEINLITSIRDDKEHYVTSSKTFNKDIGDILDIMKDEEISIKVVKPVSKGGRTYLTCELI